MKKYEKAELEVLALTADIICTSDDTTEASSSITPPEPKLEASKESTLPYLDV